MNFERPVVFLVPHTQVCQSCGSPVTDHPLALAQHRRDHRALATHE